MLSDGNTVQQRGRGAAAPVSSFRDDFCDTFRTARSHGRVERPTRPPARDAHATDRTHPGRPLHVVYRLLDFVDCKRRRRQVR